MILIPQQNYDDAASDSNQEWLASQGITLTNFFAVTHPSQPNYCASAGGDTFGMDDDNYHRVPSNVSTIVDLLDTKQIAWAEYQEHLPYPGFEGYNYSNQETFANDYVRKHNPLIQFDSVTQNDTRLSQIKNFTDFNADLANKKLPQWAFITPNMTNDGHDTNITFAARWERDWMSSLLNNSYFMNGSLILLTFDEDMTYTKSNRIFSILLGGAVPEHLKNTTDDTFYTHYSILASIEANWGLPSLGRWDCGANQLDLVANKTGYINYDVDKTNLRVNETYPGPLSGEHHVDAWPVPLTGGQKCSAGHGILDSVRSAYRDDKSTFHYASPFPWDAKSNYNTRVTASRKLANGSTSTFVPSTSAAAAAGKRSGAALVGPSFGSLGLGVAVSMLCFLVLL